MQLTKGVFKDGVVGLFGLESGKRNGYYEGTTVSLGEPWYNGFGEYVGGFSFLTAHDLLSVAKGIELGETFIIANYACWRARFHDVDVYNPGIEFVARHAKIIVKRGQLFLVKQPDDDLSDDDIGTFRAFYGHMERPYKGRQSFSRIPFLVISPEQAKAMLLGHPSS